MMIKMKSRLSSGPTQTERNEFQDCRFPRIKFLWVRKQSSFLRQVSNNVIREICSYLEVDYIPRVLPGIKGNALRLYDLRGGETKQATLSKTFTEGTMYCVVSDHTILCLGGFNREGLNPSDVYSLELSNYQLSQLPSMSLGRNYFGILRCRDFVYVFGGNVSPSISSCEKFDLIARRWTSLPDMAYPRYAFSPAEFNGEVYLADFYQTRIIEVFNLRTEIFKTLPITLVPLGTNGVCFIAEDELIALTSIKTIGRWRIGSAETIFQIAQLQTSVSPICSNCPPVQIGREVLMVHYSKGDLMRFQLDTQILSW